MKCFVMIRYLTNWHKCSGIVYIDIRLFVSKNMFNDNASEYQCAMGDMSVCISERPDHKGK